MIKNIGTDLVEKKRIKKIFKKFGDKFVDKILTNEEKEFFEERKGEERKVSFLSNNFACKEAVTKALGTGFSEGISLKQIQILRLNNGSPYVKLVGTAKKVANDNGYKNFYLSISDTKDLSLSVVIGEGS